MQGLACGRPVPRRAAGCACATRRPLPPVEEAGPSRPPPWALSELARSLVPSPTPAPASPVPLDAALVARLAGGARQLQAVLPGLESQILAELTSFNAEKLVQRRVASQAMHVCVPTLPHAPPPPAGPALRLLPGWGASTLLALRCVLMTANALAVAARVSDKPPRAGGLLALLPPEDGLLDGVAALWTGARFCAASVDEAGEWGPRPGAPASSPPGPAPGLVLLVALAARAPGCVSTPPGRVLGCVERLRSCGTPFVLVTLVLGDNLGWARAGTRDLLTRLSPDPLPDPAVELASAVAAEPVDVQRLARAQAAALARSREPAVADLLRAAADRAAAAALAEELGLALGGATGRGSAALPGLRAAAQRAAAFAASAPAVSPRVAADLNALLCRVRGRAEALQSVEACGERLAAAAGAPGGGTPDDVAELRAALRAATAAPWPWQLARQAEAAAGVLRGWEALGEVRRAAADRDPVRLPALLAAVRAAHPGADVGPQQRVADELAAEGALAGGDTRLGAYRSALATARRVGGQAGAVVAQLRGSLGVSDAEHHVCARGLDGADAGHEAPPPDAASGDTADGTPAASAAPASPAPPLPAEADPADCPPPGWKACGGAGSVWYDEEAVLGVGSRGTYCFRGSVALTSRARHPAAVKRIARPPGPAGRLCAQLVEREVEVCLLFFPCGGDNRNLPPPPPPSVQLLTQLAGPHVVALLGWAATDAHLFVATELCLEDLGAFVRRSPGLDTAHRLRLLQDAAQGVAALHAAGVAHNDLKPANLLVARDGRLKLADVGLGVALGGADGGHSYSLATFGQYGVVVNMCGRAPEALAGQRLTLASDVFALGTLFYFVLTGQPGPFAGDDAIRAGAFSLAGLMRPGGLSTRAALEARHLLASMLAPDPGDRPGAAAVLRHPLFASPEAVLQAACELHASGALADDRLAARAAAARALSGGAGAERAALLAACACDAQGWAARVHPPLLERLARAPGARYDDTLAALLRFARNAWEHPPSGAEARGLALPGVGPRRGRPGVSQRRALLAHHLLAQFPTLGIAVFECEGGFGL